MSISAWRNNPVYIEMSAFKLMVSNYTFILILGIIFTFTLLTICDVFVGELDRTIYTRTWLKKSLISPVDGDRLLLQIKEQDGFSNLMHGYFDHWID